MTLAGLGRAVVRYPHGRKCMTKCLTGGKLLKFEHTDNTNTPYSIIIIHTPEYNSSVAQLYLYEVLLCSIIDN